MAPLNRMLRMFPRPVRAERIRAGHRPRAGAPGRRGFTLIELATVVTILGILAAVGAPRVAQWLGSSREASLRSNLRQVRDAIDRYAAEHAGRLPAQSGTEAGFIDDLRPYLRTIPVNPLKPGNQVDVQTTGAPLSRVPGPASWRYDNQTGQFIANLQSMSSDGKTRYDEW